MPLFDELLLKVAKQEKLTPNELEDFRQGAKKLNEVREIVSSWLQAGSKYPKIEAPTFGQPTWTDSPLQVLQVVKTSLSVAHNTQTYITWDDTLTSNKGKAFRLDPADTSKIRVVYPGINFSLQGTVNWAFHITGLRQVGATFYDKDNNSLGSQSYSVLSTVETDETYCPFADVVIAPGLVDLAYFKMFVRQTSGGSLSLDSVRASFFQV